MSNEIATQATPITNRQKTININIRLRGINVDWNKQYVYIISLMIYI